MQRLHLGKTAIIYPAAFAAAFAIMQASLGLTFFARDVHHADLVTIGWLAGTWAITYTACCLFIRPWLRRVPVGAQLLTALFGICAVITGMQLVPGIAGLFVLQGVFGLLLSLYWPALMGWLSTDSEGAELGRLVSRFNLSWSIGNIVGPFACGWLVHVHVRLSLAAASIVLLGTGLYVAVAGWRVPGLRAQLSRPIGFTDTPMLTDRSTALRFPAWIGHFAAYFAAGVVAGTFPIGAREELGFTETRIGMILLVRGLLNTVAFIGMGHTSAWHFRFAPMIASQLLATAAFVLLIGAHTPVAITLLLSLANLAAGISYSASIFHGASGSLDRTHRMAIHEALIGIGLFVGSASGGMVYAHTSLAGTYALGAAVLGVSALLQVVAHVRTRAGG